MIGLDEAPISSSNLALNVRDEDSFSEISDQSGSGSSVTRVQAQSKFRQFLTTFTNENQVFYYRDKLQASYVQGDYFIDIDVDDLRGFDPSLMELVRSNPTTYLPLLEKAAREVVARLSRVKVEDIHPIQVQLENYPVLTNLRDLKALHVSTLVTVRGIVVQTSRSRVQATRLSIMCRNCKVIKNIPCSAGFGSTRIPRVCDTPYVQDSGLPKCPLDPYRVLGDSSSYVDQQRLKLQESPEHTPQGQMPRHITMAVSRNLVGKVKPGSRVTVIGVYNIYTPKSGKDRNSTKEVRDVGIRIPYLQVVGISSEQLATSRVFSREDEEEIHEMSRTDDLYEKIAHSMAPAMFGHEDIKKAIVCMLFGGARKNLPDGMRLRGDINILLLGDPSVGKSQFLKFAIQAAPIGVYTSGKGSSAAGLTASVIRDPGSGEFHLEGGALVLADGGLVCIDEFDKMREQDRVAIHEAMEQQTISIAKAGITTILNSRASVLAAANPVFSRYDDMKSPTENIDFQTTILSRFDLIFIVRDIINADRDTAMAIHIVNVHKKMPHTLQSNNEAVFEIDKLKKYIAYGRDRVDPRLSLSAATKLENMYVTMRKDMRELKHEQQTTSAIPITVRQLEAIVRISESLARLELKNVVTDSHVDEAIRLFRVSTFQAATASYGERIGSPAFQAMVARGEAFLDKRLGVGMTESVRTLTQEMMRTGLDENAAVRAMELQAQRGKFVFKNMRKSIQRRV